MTPDVKVLCVISARGGSKGVPGKNLKLLAGKPLVAHAIGNARAARLVSRVIFSSEDRRLAETARK